MCAYNAIDGAPACANTMLLQRSPPRRLALRRLRRQRLRRRRRHLHRPSLRARHGPRRRRCREGRHRSRMRLSARARLIPLSSTPSTRTSSPKPKSTPRCTASSAPASASACSIRPPATPTAASPSAKTTRPRIASFPCRPRANPWSCSRIRTTSCRSSPTSSTIAVIGPTAELVQSLQGNYNGPPPIARLPARRHRKALLLVASPLRPGLDPRRRLCHAHRAHRAASRLPAGRGDSASPANISRPADFTGTPVLTRTDRNINFNWDKVVPVAGLQRNNYSVRWTGDLHAARARRLQARRPRQLLLRLRKRRRLPALPRRQADRRKAPAKDRRARRGLRRVRALRLTQSRTPFASNTSTAPAAPASTSPGRLPPPSLRDEAVKAAKQSDIDHRLRRPLAVSSKAKRCPSSSTASPAAIAPPSILPAVQEELLKALAATGKPLIVVLAERQRPGRQLGRRSTPTPSSKPGIPAKKAAPPSPKHSPATTIPPAACPSPSTPRSSQLPPFDDYSMKDRTYRYFTGKPLYPFGYGLSYTTFRLQRPQGSRNNVKAGDPVTCRSRGEEHRLRRRRRSRRALPHPAARLRNSHPRARRVSRACISTPASPPTSASPSTPRSIAQVDEQGNRVILPGEYDISIGGGPPGFASTSSARFTITGQKDLPK